MPKTIIIIMVLGECESKREIFRRERERPERDYTMKDNVFICGLDDHCVYAVIDILLYI